MHSYLPSNGPALANRARSEVNTQDHRNALYFDFHSPKIIHNNTAVLLPSPCKQMDSSYKFPGSPGTPLFQVSPERVNQQRPISMFDPDSDSASLHHLSESRGGHSRESSVHDKVAQFNSLAFQGKQLERKANDAALKRAMLGREEAESEMRRYRDETRSLRRQVEEGKERERKVGERLETVMVCQGFSAHGF